MTSQSHVITRRQALKLSASAAISTGVATAPAGATAEGMPPLDNARVATRIGNRSSVAGTHTMACSSQPLATAVGHDVLRGGGNAIDAAVAINAMLGVVEPFMCGIGGDLFAIIWIEEKQRLYGLNASGRSPGNFDIATAHRLGLKKIPDFGPLSWSVPGCVDGWNTLLKKFGSQSLESLLSAAIAYAREGFPVSPIIADGWKPERGATDTQTLEGVYFNNGKGPSYGDLFRNPGLANAYERIAKHGADDFYRGEIAERIDRFCTKAGGFLSRADLAVHQSEWVKPVSTRYRDHDIWQLPPNSQGIAVLQMLNLIEKFDLGSLKVDSPELLHC